MKLVIASTNDHKLEEIRKILQDSYELTGLKSLGFDGEIPETGDTLEENALIKARFVYDKYHTNCVADDSGLLVSALNGRPGVFSARYAGVHATSDQNIDLLLSELKNQTDRSAEFRTVLVLILDGKEYLFNGTIKGQITLERHGSKGFGYDPVFMPTGKSITFAQMSPDEKNSISHRALALKALAAFLNTLK